MIINVQVIRLNLNGTFVRILLTVIKKSTHKRPQLLCVFHFSFFHFLCFNSDFCVWIIRTTSIDSLKVLLMHLVVTLAHNTCSSYFRLSPSLIRALFAQCFTWTFVFFSLHPQIPATQYTYTHFLFFLSFFSNKIRKVFISFFQLSFCLFSWVLGKQCLKLLGFQFE